MLHHDLGNKLKLLTVATGALSFYSYTVFFLYKLPDSSGYRLCAGLSIILEPLFENRCKL